MKFLVIGDLHIGVGSDDAWQEKIREELLKQTFEYAIQNNIKQLVFLGDIFDDRSSLTHRALEFNRINIIEPIVKNDLNAIMIIGNHDAMHKNTLTPNAVSEVFGKIDNFNVVDSVKTIRIGESDIDFVSWICKDNIFEIQSFIKESKSRYCFGHFELVGFYYYSGIKADKGDDPSFLQKYEYVGSGHYHTINGHGNVQYLGSPFTITSNDVNEIRGIWEFDSNNIPNPKLIPNNKIWHRKISYPLDINIESFGIDKEEYRDTRVVIDLNDKEDKGFRILESELEGVVNRLRIVNNYAINNAINTHIKVDSNIRMTGGPLELAQENITKDDSLSDIDKESINQKIKDLYMSAQNKRGVE